MMSRAASCPVRSLCLSVLASCLLSSCAVGPDFVKPDPPAVASYLPVAQSNTGQSAQNLIDGAAVPKDWWQLFGCAQLDGLVRQALAHNATLEAALATLQQSQHNLQAGYGIFFPQVGLALAGERERSAPIEQGLHSASNIFNVVTASAGVSYDLDLFGANRRALEGLGAQVDYQRFSGQAAYVTLSANVVNTVIARAAYLKQLQTVEQLILLQQQQLGAIQAQVKAGTAAYTTELGIRSLIASSQAELAGLKQQISQADNLLASLSGKFPSEAALPAPEFDQLKLPSDLPLSLPSELVRQRPDILQSEAQLHAASANIGVTTAAMFPHISLNGSVGQAGTNLSNLSNGDGKFWSVGPSVALPLFSGGSQWFQRKAAQDAFAAAQASYRQTVLSAFAQVATLIQALEHDRQAWLAQSDAKAYAGQALQSTTAGYNSGVNSWLDVLVADVQYHQASLAAIQAEAQRYQDTVGLFAALGGGWWNDAGQSP